jgi:outer membrane protein TolC
MDAQQDLARIKNDILASKTQLYLAGLNLKYAMGEDIITEAR